MRGYLFTDRDRGRLRAWLESGVEDDGTRKLFVPVRRNLNRITNDVGLLVAVARRLQAEERLMGRARLPRDLARAARRLEGGRLTVPVEVVESSGLERGELMKVIVPVDE